ncbi:MAG: hypothetical protein Q6365_002665, partial [Candidatus Sigynarchaeota archaeon]
MTGRCSRPTGPPASTAAGTAGRRCRGRGRAPRARSAATAAWRALVEATSKLNAFALVAKRWIEEYVDSGCTSTRMPAFINSFDGSTMFADMPSGSIYYGYDRYFFTAAFAPEEYRFIGDLASVAQKVVANGKVVSTQPGQFISRLPTGMKVEVSYSPIAYPGGTFPTANFPVKIEITVNNQKFVIAAEYNSQGYRVGSNLVGYAKITAITPPGGPKITLSNPVYAYTGEDILAPFVA